MDRVEIFSNIAHNLVPKVENLLLEVVDFIEDPLPELVKDIHIAAGKIERQVKREYMSCAEAEAFFEQYRNLAINAMAGHQCVLGKSGQVNGLANQMTDLFKRKNADYGDSFGKSLKKWGFHASIIRIEDKINRLDSLVCKKNKNEVKDENIADTFIDLANYAIMTIVYDYIISEEMRNEFYR